MPGGDKTGPLGYGPMTGRGAGYCSGNRAPGYINAPFGRGRGCGGGRGRRNMYYATGLPRWGRAAQPEWSGNIGPAYFDDFTPEREMEMLKAQSGFFQKQIDALNGRIRELEGLATTKDDAKD